MKILQGMLTKFKCLRFRNKLVLSYIILGIVPVLTLGIVSYEQSITALNDQMKVAMNNNVQQVAYTLSSRLEKNNEFIKFTAFCPYVTEELTTENTKWYELSQKLNRYFEPLSWYNLSINRDFEHLTIYANYLARPIGSFLQPAAPIANEEWYNVACKMRDTRWFFENGTLYASRRMYEADREILIGVVRMQMNTQYLMNSILSQQTAPMGFVLTDEKGELLYQYSTVENVDGQDIKASVLQDSDGRVNIEQGSFFVASKRVAGVNWQLHCYTPTSEYTKKAEIILVYTVLTVVICLLIMLFLVWLFSRTLVKRIEKLNSKVLAVENGNLGIEISSKATDEIGMLSNSFGRMLNRVNDLIETVYYSQIVEKTATLKSLQSQINPHFLYNTLSLINWLAIDANKPEISRVAGLLSTFYRTSLNKGESKIRVQDEINNIMAYIDIQLIMHDNNFSVSYEIMPEVYDYYTVNFTLQPIVENAILHGLDENEEVFGKLWVRAFIKEQDIVFEIEDNGVGMSEETASKLCSHQSVGYGVKNVNERLQLCYGEKYSVNVSSRLGQGTIIRLIIPRQ